MPQTSCGHAYRNKLVIPTIGEFPLGVEDIRITMGTQGSKSLTVALGSFTDTIGAKRLEYMISLYHVTRAVYEALKGFAEQDILSNYLTNYKGSIQLDFNGESDLEAIIKECKSVGSAYFEPGTNVEYLEKIDLKILASEYRLI